MRVHAGRDSIEAGLASRFGRMVTLVVVAIGAGVSKLRRRLRLGTLAVVGLMSACGPSPPIGTAPPVNSSVEAVGEVESQWTTDAELDRAIAFRRAAGLRADRSWTRFVATSPESRPGIAAFSVPLMPDELAQLQRRAVTMDEIMPVIESYGTAHPDEWAGAYIDSAHGRAVALFTDRVAEHEDALRRLLRPHAPLDVLDATWTLRELEALQREITSQIPWLREQDYFFLGAGVDLKANTAFLEVSSADPDAERRLLEHFDGLGKLMITSDGTGARLLPTGSLTGIVTDPDGQPIEGLLVELAGDVPGTAGTDIGQGTGKGGRFRFTDIAAIGYDILLYAEDGDARILRGEDRAVVRAGKTTEVIIVLDLD